MSYLLDLIKSFDDDELNRFRALEVVGKEQLVRDAYAAQAQQKDSNEAALQRKLEITKSHFDKITSVLLDKSLTHLAGPDRKAKLEFLAAKQLYDLVLH